MADSLDSLANGTSPGGSQMPTGRTASPGEGDAKLSAGQDRQRQAGPRRYWPGADAVHGAVSKGMWKRMHAA